MQDIYQSHGWQIVADRLRPGWGVEDMLLVGGWTGEQDEGNLDSDEFQHHNNWVADWGWRMISFAYGYQVRGPSDRTPEGDAPWLL